MKLKLKDVEEYKKIKEQIQQLHEEISELSKKKPNDEINSFKLRFINQLLVRANALITKEFMPFDDFTIFSVEELPSNSDVAMMLGQYLTCLERFRIAHIKYENYEWRWIINGQASDMEAADPNLD